MAESRRPPTAIEHFDAGAAAYERSTGRCTRELACALLDLPQLQGLCSAGAVVLDNVCGTAIVAEAIITRCRQQNTSIPGDTPFDLPVPKPWLAAAHVEHCLRSDGGFADVEMLERAVHYGAATREELRAMLLDTFQVLWKDWTGEELERFKGAMAECIENVAEPYTMLDGEPGVGIRMRAIVAVCRK